MHEPGVSRSSLKGPVLPRLLRPQSGFPESPYLAGRYGEIDNEIDNLDNLEFLVGGYGEIENEIDNLDNLGWQGRGCLVLAQV